MLKLLVFSSKENRLLARGVFGNVKNVVAGAWKENVGVPAENGNYAKAALGVPVAVLDNVMTAPDAAYAGLLGEEIEPLKPGSFSRTTRDIKSIGRNTASAIGNLLTLHPWEAAKSLGRDVLGVIRITGSVPMDIVNDATGVSVVERRQAQFHDRLFSAAA